ncbi:hypothetical protein R70006_07657 [Paraburkholderia domus]|nr:hypothetical protein R70006_07657 [Paraburkholderia domus]CAE6966141.1 hypothetical protein R75471_07028 [Paraburkholderia domus]
MMQRVHDHLRPEIRAADADVHDIANPLAGIAGPLAAADLVGECGHLGALRLDFRMERRLRISGAQRGVQRGAAFGRVDDFAREHRVAAFLDAGFARELHQQFQGFVGDAVLRKIGRETAARERKALSTGRSGIVLGGEPVAHVRIANLLVMRLQRGPCGHDLIVVSDQALHFQP